MPAKELALSARGQTGPHVTIMTFDGVYNLTTFSLWFTIDQPENVYNWITILNDKSKNY